MASLFVALILEPSEWASSVFLLCVYVFKYIHICLSSSLYVCVCVCDLLPTHMGICNGIVSSQSRIIWLC